MELVYFASPMCSWCWGFSPVIQQIIQRFDKQIKLRLVLVPFRIDTGVPMGDQLRSYVLGQWHKVHAATGQPFDFAFSMGQEFVYDTKPVCLAIKAFSKQESAQQLDYMNAIQNAFYTKNLNVTSEDVLLDLISNYKINSGQFIQDLHSKDNADLLSKDFVYCDQLAVKSYPTLVGVNNNSIAMFVQGYAPYAVLAEKIEDWLSKEL